MYDHPLLIQASYRFWYIHPERIKAIAIGAPGTLTRLSNNASWPDGCGDAEGLFGVKVDPARLRGTPVQLALGELDVGGRDSATLTRPQIIDGLTSDLDDAGAQVERVTLPGVDHMMGIEPAMKAQQAFIAKHLVGQ